MTQPAALWTERCSSGQSNWWLMCQTWRIGGLCLLLLFSDCPSSRSTLSQEQRLCPCSDMEIHYATVKAMKGTKYPLCLATALQSRDFAELVSACVQIQAGTAPQLILCDSNNFVFVCLFVFTWLLERSWVLPLFHPCKSCCTKRCSRSKTNSWAI